MIIKKLKEFFEKEDFKVHLTRQDNRQCAEVEKWTDGGVDMIIWLNPFTVAEFKSYVDNFDVDEQVQSHYQDSNYKANFTIRESLDDFTNFHNHLKEVVSKLP